MTPATQNVVGSLPSPEWQLVERDYEHLLQTVGIGFASHRVVADEAGEPVDFELRAASPVFERLVDRSFGDLRGRFLSEVLEGVSTSAALFLAGCRGVAAGRDVRCDAVIEILGRPCAAKGLWSRPGMFVTVFQDLSVGAQTLPAADCRGTEASTNMALETVRHQSGLLRAIGDTVSETLLIVDQEGRCLESLTPGIQPPEGSGVRGMGLRELLPEAGVDKLLGLVAATIASGQRQSMTCDGRQVAGHPPCRVKTALLEQPVAGQTAVLVAIQDQSEAFLANQARLHSERENTELIDCLQYGVYRSSVDGRFLSVNRALVAMLGYDSAEELLAIDMAHDLYQQSDERARVRELYRKAKVLRNLELRWKKKSGEPILVRVDGRLRCDENGGLAGYQMIVEDITERQHFAEKARQLQTLEAVGLLTGGVAHDFNNLLSVVLLNVQLLKSAANREAPISRESVDDIESAALTAAALVKQLMGFSRRSTLERRPTDLGEAVGCLVATLRLPSTIELREEFVAAPMVDVDRRALEQMFGNLIANALDAMSGAGDLRVRVAPVEPTPPDFERCPWLKPGPFVAVTVSDSGRGMDDETLRRVFEPFFTTKPPGSATGLGMAVVYGLMRNHGGFVDVASAPKAGTTVRLVFPAGADDRHARPVSRGPEAGGSETILVVEDSTPLRRVTKRALERHGFSVVVAADGVEAMERFASAQPPIDLVISDAVMPRMGGRALHQALMDQPKPPAFILTSGYEDDAGELPNDGSIAFIQKPWQVAQLVSLVREELDRVSVKEEP